MLDLSDFFKEYWLIIFVSVAWVIAWYKFAYSKIILFKIFMDTLFVKTPVIWDVVKTYYMYKFSNLLSQFYEAWVSPVVSLNLLASIFDNFNYKKKMLDAKSDLESWFTLYEALSASYLFDPILTQIINVWENTWSLTSVLAKMAIFYRNNFRNTIDMATSLIQPLFMVLIASVVWLIVAAIYLPMADMLQAVSNL
jgi:type IV pilus assembly protein PilC